MLNTHQVHRYAKACAARADMQIVWKVGQVPCTDGKTIYLPVLGSDNDPAEVLHYVAHEVGHVLHSDFAVLEEKGVPANSVLAMVWNVVEDHRVNYLNAMTYEGDRQHDEIFYYATIAKLLEKEGLPAPVVEVFQWESAVHADFAPSLNTLPLVVRPALEKYSDVLRNIRSIVDGTEGTTASYVLAQTIVEELYTPPKEEAPAPEEGGEGERGEGDDGAEGEEGSGEGDEGDAGESEDAAPTEDGADEEAGGGDAGGEEGTPEEECEDGERVEEEVGEEEDTPSKEAPPAYTVLSPKSYEEFLPCVDGEHVAGEAAKVSLAAYTPVAGYTPTPPTAMSHYDYRSGKCVLKNPPEHLYPADAETAVSLGRYFRKWPEGGGSTFVNKVRNKLQIRSRSRVQYAQKKGKLHNGGLHRVCIKGAKGYSERIFKNKVESDTLDTAVCVLVDFSGSMCGDKFYYAVHAASLLSAAVGDALHIPLEIVGFSTVYRNIAEGECTALSLHRGFETHRLEDKALVEGMCHFFSSTGHNNADGEALSYCHDKLLRRREKRKILIVISDGVPWSSRERGDIIHYTHDVIADIEKRREVELYGVGLLDDAVSRFYKRNIVLTAVETLESTLFSILDHTL